MKKKILCLIGALLLVICMDYYIFITNLQAAQNAETKKTNDWSCNVNGNDVIKGKDMALYNLVKSI